MHGLRVVRNVMAYLEQHRYGKLRDGGGAVGRDVADRYAASLCVFIVDDVIARRSDGDIFKAGAGVDDRVAYRDLVCDDDLRIAYAADDLRLAAGCAVIDLIFAERLEPVQLRSPGFSVYPSRTTAFIVQFLRFVFSISIIDSAAEYHNKISPTAEKRRGLCNDILYPRLTRTHGFDGQKSAHTSSKALPIHKVLPAAFSSSDHFSATAKTACT